MKKLFAFAAMLLTLSTPLYAWNKLFPEPYILSRTIGWSYDGSCTVSPLPEMLRATRIWDRLLTNVTITYLGADGTGFNYTDNKNTVSCHTAAWFADGSGTYHRTSASGAGAFGDHSTNTITGEHLFDIAFRDDIVTADGKAGAALHEFTHVLGLDHPPMTAANHWSAVYGDPFGFLAPSAKNPYMSAWTEYPSNDDIVGLSAFYGGQAADCTPYLSTSNKLYLPFIPASGAVNPSVYATGYWAVLQWNGAGTATMLEYGITANYNYNCAESFSGGTLTATGYRESTQSMMPFHLINNDPTGTSVSSWTITSP